MSRQRTRNELRCECRRRPLLAVYGLDDKNRVYLHVKVFKSHRIYGEILIYRGEIQLRCRECLRWYTIFFRDGHPKLVETPEPDSIADEAGVGHG